MFSSCSLLFSSTSPAVVDGGFSDGATSDSGVLADAPSAADSNMGPDASGICNADPENTQLKYSFDGQHGNMMIMPAFSESESASGIVGSVMAGDEEGGAASLSVVAFGDYTCTEAASFVGNTTFIQIPADSLFEATRSVDFWFYPVTTSGGHMLTKNQYGAKAGDFGIGVAPTSDNSLYLAFWMQDGTTTYGLCGGPLTEGAWHHVAVSFGASQELFLDGERATNVEALTQAAGSGSDILRWCDNGAATNLDLTANTRSWIVGASNGYQGNGTFPQGSSTDIRDHFKGYIDELRFRSVPFTLAEAMTVFNAGY